MTTGKKYWRSLEQLAETPRFREWLHREFPAGTSEPASTTSRRRMLQLMAASFGLAGLTACRRPVEKILPSSYGSEVIVPGAPLWYATIMTTGGFATGLLVESHDGRPTKTEGNPNHPSSVGATSAYAQAAVLALYDPDRSRTLLHRGKPSSWDEFNQFAKRHFDPARMGDGARLRFLSETIGSPSLEAVKAHALERFPKAKWIEYDPLSHDQVLSGAQLAFGAAYQPQYHFDRADVVVALDSDFLGQDALSMAWIRDFARRRHAEPDGGSMNRLYAVESRHSMTGAMADHRLRLRPSDVRRFAEDLARALGALGDSSGVRDKFLAALARDLGRRRGRSLVLAGPRQPAEVHALAHLINQALGNAGETVTYTRWPKEQFQVQAAALHALAAEMAAGEVETLVILGGNPVFNSPADMDFAGLMRKVPDTIRLGLEEDETTTVSSWHLPEAHFLEAWGDGRALDGTASVQQPLIEPLYGGRTAAEVAALLTGYKDQRAYDIVRNYWLPQWPAAEAERTWRRALHDGVVPGTQFQEASPAADGKRIEDALRADHSAKPAGLEIAFFPGWATWDGRFANNGWLQEAPEPMTRLTWDNAALLSPATARKLGVETGDIVTLVHGGREALMPVLIQPGHADQCISLAVGYGRRLCGRVGRNVGFNAFALRTTGAPWSAFGAELRKTGRTHRLAITQNHHSMEGRPLILEATLEEYRKDSRAAVRPAPHDEPFSLYKERSYDQGYQWGMAIDLNACVGCNACVLACQAENNVPIVGKDQVMRGREMHWIRVDRYYQGAPEDARAVVQPVTCQQCENAPCENVCPVAATSHSPEGLNDMAYNRCVGTRYCSNNCPYKVRRFNFLDFHKGLTEVGKMVFNPDVTVRMRGVMEKCTYCVQRIEEKKIQAMREGHRALKDGEIRTACQQVCPAEAVVFGNINDPASRVSRLRRHNRGYGLLAELNTKPRTTYLAKLRNPNPELA
jgi:MoCo/4Fe-4S cofactor protein with predicted Tat translocation signal